MIRASDLIVVTHGALPSRLGRVANPVDEMPPTPEGIRRAMAGPIGVEPINDWFKASLLYLFAYSPLAPTAGLEPTSKASKAFFLSIGEVGMARHVGVEPNIATFAGLRPIH